MENPLKLLKALSRKSTSVNDNDVSVWIQDGKLRLRCPNRMAPKAGAIPGLRAERDTEDWVGLPSWSTILAVGSEFGSLPGFAASPEVEGAVDHYLSEERYAAARKANQDLDEAMSLRLKQHSDAVAPSGVALFDYQRHGVAMMVQLERVLLLDEMGVGKGPQAASALWITGGWPALVVAPNSMKYKWADELNRWCPGITTFVLQGARAKREKIIAEASDLVDDGLAVAVITNWESLRTLSRLAPYGSVKLSAAEKSTQPLNRIDWVTVISDELHAAKDAKAKRTRALWQVAKGARYRWGLTGTPVLNTPGDIWAMGRFVCPEEFSTSRLAWANRYVLSFDTRWGPQDIGLRRDTRAEFLRVFDMHSIRRLKRDVLSLPPITRQVLRLEMTGKQATAYRQMQKTMLAELDNGILVATDTLTKDTRLRQMASATPVLDPEGNVIELMTPSNKIAALIEIIEGAPGPLVVFAESRKLIDAAAKAIEDSNTVDVKVVKLTGEIPPEARHLAVSAFQSGKADVALCTLGASSEGIDLFAASTAVFLQRSYKAGESKQAEARIHRHGQTADKVTIIDLVSKNTVDEHVLEALEDKGRMAEEVTRDTLRAALTRKL